MKTHFLHGRALEPLCGVSKLGSLGSVYTDVVDCVDCCRDARFHEAQKDPKKRSQRADDSQPMSFDAKEVQKLVAESERGLRFNKRKLPVHLISPFVTRALAKQLQFGIDKGYPARNWEKGLSWSETIASLERHLLNFKMGNDFDDEENPVTKEKLPELYGVICNAMFLLHFYETKTGTDDRVKYAEPAQIVSRLTLVRELPSPLQQLKEEWALREKQGPPLTTVEKHQFDALCELVGEKK